MLDRRIVRDVVLVCGADGIVGVSLGALATAAGWPVWLTLLLSVGVFAGASQFVFLGIVAAGGAPFAATAAALLVNARHLPFGYAVGDVLRTWPQRLLGSHVLTDEATAFTMAQRDPARRRAVYWLSGIGLFVVWNLGVFLGALGGSAIDDIGTWGLDAAFPAVVLALVMPSLRDRPVALAGLVGAVIALLATPWTPAGLPVLLALVAVPLAASLGRAA